MKFTPNLDKLRSMFNKEILNQVQNDNYADLAVCHSRKIIDTNEILNQLMAAPTHTGSVGSFLAASLCKVQNDSYEDLAVCKSRKLNDMKKSKTLRKKAAFTLAETLIAIGIIGVVAALTIPTLMRKYEKSVIEKNLAKTYSELQNVIRRSEADNGSFEGWDYSLYYTTFVDTYFKPYMQLDMCMYYGHWNSYDPKLCFNQNYGIWLNGKTGTKETGGIDVITPKYKTKDGRYIAILSNFDTLRNIKNIYITVDVNGSAGKSILGQDVFRLILSSYNSSSSKGLQFGNLPYSGGGNYRWSTEELRKSCYLKTGGSQRYDCGLLIQRNGWKFPSDYPFAISELKDSL
jgi:type II secretory pathway pseudopilin PulG